MVNLQEIKTLSKEQLQDLYKTGHILSKEGWYHAGRDSVDPWNPYRNWEMNNLRILLNAMEAPTSSVVGVKKQVGSDEDFFVKEESITITFHYDLAPALHWSYHVTLTPGTNYATYDLALKLRF